MTIIRQGPGVLLLLPREELPSPAPTQEELLPLIRSALSRGCYPIPAALEIRAFPGRQGVLCLVLPAFGGPEENIFREFS